jgi:hypothetical protein
VSDASGAVDQAQRVARRGLVISQLDHGPDAGRVTKRHVGEVDDHVVLGRYLIEDAAEFIGTPRSTSPDTLRRARRRLP